MTQQDSSPPAARRRTTSVPSTEDARYPFELHGVVVSYETGPDWCNIHPRGLARHERLEAWLSADTDAFVPLREMR